MEEPTKQHLVHEEAQKFLEVPPVPVAAPTDPFWAHFESDIDETSLEQSDIFYSKISTVIIGGGLTGISMAYWLTQNGIPGDEILLIEARKLGDGATGRNGGHCWPSTRVWSRKERDVFGLDNLIKSERWKFESAQLFMKWIEDQKFDCDFHRVGACETTKFTEEIDGFKEFLEEKGANFHGTTVELWDGETTNRILSGTKWQGALHSTLAGQFWPRKLVYSIAKLVLAHGVHIRTKTVVNQILRHSEPNAPFQFSLTTNAGIIQCNRLLHATNAYASSLLPNLKGVIVPVRGQVLATKPVKSFLLPHNIGFDDGAQYLIHRQGDRRIIFGGMRWRAQTFGKEVAVSDDSNLDVSVSEALRSALPEYFPSLATEPGFGIDYEWTGIMGFTGDNWPLIGRLRNDFNEWIAAGYSGNGMPQCFGAAKAVADMIAGKLETGDAWIPHFNPQRFCNESYARKWVYTGESPLKMEE